MFQNILVPIDLSHETSWRRVLPMAVEQARNSGAQLHLVTVVGALDLGLPAVHLPQNFNEQRIEDARQRLEALVKEQVPGEVSVRLAVRVGAPYQEILHEARDINADLIVMASHRPEMKDYLLGSNAARVVRHADCSVMVVRGE